MKNKFGKNLSAEMKNKRNFDSFIVIDNDDLDDYQKGNFRQHLE